MNFRQVLRVCVIGMLGASCQPSTMETRSLLSSKNSSDQSCTALADCQSAGDSTQKNNKSTGRSQDEGEGIAGYLSAPQDKIVTNESNGVIRVSGEDGAVVSGQKRDVSKLKIFAAYVLKNELSGRDFSANTQSVPYIAGTLKNGVVKSSGSFSVADISAQDDVLVLWVLPEEQTPAGTIEISKSGQKLNVAFYDPGGKLENLPQTFDGTGEPGDSGNLNHDPFCTPEVKAGSYANAAGTVDDPYKLCTAKHLEDFYLNHAPEVGKFAKLLTDIDYENVEREPFGAGLPGRIVSASLEGDGYVIKNIKIKCDITHCGFIARFDGEHFKGLRFESVNIEGTDNVGLIGTVSSGNITDISVDGVTVKGLRSVGAVAGYFGRGFIQRVIVRQLETNSDIFHMEGTEGVGGVVGATADTATIESVVAEHTNVTGGQQVGGLVGRNESVSTSYISVVGGKIRGTTNSVGGAFGEGYLSPVATLSQSVIVPHSITAPSTSINVGAIIGRFGSGMPNMTDNYFYFTGPGCNNCDNYGGKEVAIVDDPSEYPDLHDGLWTFSQGKPPFLTVFDDSGAGN